MYAAASAACWVCCWSVPAWSCAPAPCNPAVWLAVPILLGLGVREFSVVPAAVPAIKRQVRSLRINDCRELALRCLELASPGEVRALAAEMIAIWGEIG